MSLCTPSNPATPGTSQSVLISTASNPAHCPSRTCITELPVPGELSLFPSQPGVLPSSTPSLQPPPLPLHTPVRKTSHTQSFKDTQTDINNTSTGVATGPFLIPWARKNYYFFHKLGHSYFSRYASDFPHAHTIFRRRTQIIGASHHYRAKIILSFAHEQKFSRLCHGIPNIFPPL